VKDGMLFVEHIDIDVISSYVIENNVEYLWQYLRCNAGAGADEGVKSHDAALITFGARLLKTPPDPSKTLVVMADIARDVFKVFQAHDYGETITLTLSAACAVALAGHFLVSEVEPQPPSPARGLILYLGDDAAAGARVAAQRAAQAPLPHEDTVWNMLTVMRASLTRDAHDAASAARGAEGLTPRAGDERGEGGIARHFGDREPDQPEKDGRRPVEPQQATDKGGDALAALEFQPDREDVP
jgi:hypothetical protein